MKDVEKTADEIQDESVQREKRFSVRKKRALRAIKNGSGCVIVPPCSI